MAKISFLTFRVYLLQLISLTGNTRIMRTLFQYFFHLLNNYTISNKGYQNNIYHKLYNHFSITHFFTLFPAIFNVCIMLKCLIISLLLIDNSVLHYAKGIKS